MPLPTWPLSVSNMACGELDFGERRDPFELLICQALEDARAAEDVERHCKLSSAFGCATRAGLYGDADS